ncbi:MAG: hypothetical protein ABGX84_05775 [Alcanivorax sp.]|tara:strand:+ start:405 stop:1112 length:708 start_codon:yes stop_codon:yes gene_type:complete
MTSRQLFSFLFGVAAWSLSSLAMASWDMGPCSGTGTAPCIETEINGNTYHFNGNGSHAGVWHGRPAAEGGGEFDFSGTDLDFTCDPVSWGCNLTLSGEVKKCQDSSGAWRVGVRVTDADLSAGSFACDLFTVDGFPWYFKDPTIASHCPFEDDCDSFIPYNPNASTYTGNFGSVSVSSFLNTYVDNGHLHGVVFTPGVGATFDLGNKSFFSCDEEEACSLDGVLTLDNAMSLDIH